MPSDRKPPTRPRSIQLRNVDLSGAHLEDVDLSSVRIKNANLRGTTLTDVDLRDVQIRDADLRGLTIEGVRIDLLLAARKR